MEDNNYTNGKPYILTHHETEGEYSTSLHYLLPNGSRRKVTIASAEDSEEMRHKIGTALSTGELRGRNWNQGLSA